MCIRDRDTEAERMTQPEPLLCIGGPWDGERMANQEDFVRMSELPPLPIGETDSEPEYSATITYQRTLLTDANGNHVNIWLANGTNPLEELLNGYANLHMLVTKVERMQPMIDELQALRSQQALQPGIKQ